MTSRSGPVRSSEALLAPAVAEALNALDLARQDAGVARLARQYASAVDDADPEDRAAALAEFGPKLLAALTALGATPASRVKGGATGGVSRLDQLRARRTH